MAHFQGNVEKLNQFLADKSYIEGYAPTQADAAAYATVSNNFDTVKFPHVARWQSHIGSFSAAQRARFPGAKVVVAPVEEVKVDTQPKSAPAKVEAAPAKAATAAADDDSDDFNLDDDEDEDTKAMMKAKAEATKKVQERQQKKAEAGTAKSDIAFDIKPLETLEDKEENKKAMEALLAKVRSVELDGLKWMGYQFIDVAFGIMKLRIMCQIIDIKVPGGPDEVKEAIEGQEWFEELVQSVDVFSFQMAA